METAKCELNGILNNLRGSREEEILVEMSKLYSKISEMQDSWYKKSAFTCPAGCGECCRNFEPDLLDCEATFMAAWLLENQNDIALKVSQGQFPFPLNKGCPFWNENSPYHCTIYGGRAFICRLFGASASMSKAGKLLFKPCKFYPIKLLEEHKPPLAHRQYCDCEINDSFGSYPPNTTDFMESAISLNPDNHSTSLIRDILPKAVNHLLWISKLNGLNKAN
ncbi:MAG: YkgJ family cysteine cluster protein [Treponema sp.]|nr:YkgJ family cysteine cluster protein [Treponema sp.]